MSVRSGTEIGGRINLSTISRYDFLLFAVPLSLLLGTVLGGVSALPVHLGAAAGAVPSIALLCYGLFYSAPVPMSK